MKKPIRFVYFDVGDVLISNVQAMKRIAEKYNASVEDIYDLSMSHWKEACRGTLSNADYMDIFTQKFQITHPSHDVTEFWSDYQEAIPQTHALARELVVQYPLGILSNAELGILAKLLKKQKIPDISWATIIESAQYGLIKPETQLFEIAEQFAQKAGATPSEIFYIDNESEYVEAAKSRGWQGMLFDPNDVEVSVQKARNVLLSK